jgi:hypothetical protein
MGMTRIETRLIKLEQRIAIPRGCPSCCHVSPQARIVDADDPDPDDQICPNCGRVCFTTIRFGRQRERDDARGVLPFVVWAPLRPGEPIVFRDCDTGQVVDIS